jgi:acyl-CoA reductase-like NAD-dependent aldehyde dehydrogenase
LTEHGSTVIPEGAHSIPATPPDRIDEAVKTVAAAVGSWRSMGLDERIDVLERISADTARAADAWAASEAAAQGLTGAQAGEPYLLGPFPLMRNAQLLQRTLRDIRDHGQPQVEFTTRASGQVVAKVAPADLIDRILFPLGTGEVWFQPEVTLDEARASAGSAYRGREPDGDVALVLGAGNVASIAPMDALTQLFVENRGVVIKMNPVNEHVGPHLAEALGALVEIGILRIVYGGAAEGQQLTDHDMIDVIHITGSDKTYEAIVFGPGEEGRANKQAGRRRLTKPITSELSNVTPVIVVPGPWTDGDIAFHGDNLASMIVLNGGFNCVSTRVIVQHRAWARRRDLLDAIRDSLARANARKAYYPGAEDRFRAFIDAYPHAERFGPQGDEQVPWTLIPDLDPAGADDEMALQTEAFCGLTSEVALDTARSIPDYIAEAVRFCNDHVWGNLAATIIVHPRSLKDPEIRAAVDKAFEDLRYGVITTNQWSANVFGMPTATWGAYPGSTPEDIQSGTGVVHNTFMLEGVQKSIVRLPFRPPATPPLSHTHRTMDRLGPNVVRWLAGDLKAMPALTWATLRG